MNPIVSGTSFVIFHLFAWGFVAKPIFLAGNSLRVLLISPFVSSKLETVALGTSAEVIKVISSLELRELLASPEIRELFTSQFTSQEVIVAVEKISTPALAKIGVSVGAGIVLSGVVGYSAYRLWGHMNKK